MKTRLPRRGQRPGYVTLIAVLIVASMLTMLMLSMYRGAAMSRDVQGASELRIDTADKEDAVLRAIVNIAPNRAMRAMKSGSDVAGVRDALSWQSIFTDALAQANARTSVDPATLASLNLGTTYNGNPGDAGVANVAAIFKAEAQDPDFATAGINRNFKAAANFGAGYPVALNYADAAKSNLDHLYPIVSNSKVYGALANGLVGADVARYPLYNLIPYPNIHFGYGTPGVNFVAKRNWWAFSMNLAASDAVLNSAVRAGNQRDFVLSLYEIPSQLAISADAFINIGTHGDPANTPWVPAGTSAANAQVKISGPIFSTRAQVDAGIPLASVAGRNGLTLANFNSVGANALGGDPFLPGVREQYETRYNTSMPVYLSSEAGRSTFIPINAGLNFFDRYSAAAEANVLAGTSWNDYTNGASQCAMHLDVVAMNPVRLQFSYMVGANRVSTVINAADMTASAANIAAWEGASPPRPYTVKTLASSGKVCVVVRPQLFAAYLASIGASGVGVNNSISVNVNYTNSGMNNPALAPKVPTRAADCGVILSDCNDLTAFTSGFSIVTNLLLYIGDDFNQVTTAPPAGSGLTGAFSPPTSIFAPEIRYGTDVDPLKVQIAGQMGHLGGDTGATGTQARLLDLKLGSATQAAAANISVNLSQIVHPAQLPPITMKYWLVVLEERKREYYR